MWPISVWMFGISLALKICYRMLFPASLIMLPVWGRYRHWHWNLRGLRRSPRDKFGTLGWSSFLRVCVPKMASSVYVLCMGLRSCIANRERGFCSLWFLLAEGFAAC